MRANLTNIAMVSSDRQASGCIIASLCSFHFLFSTRPSYLQVCINGLTIPVDFRFPSVRRGAAIHTPTIQRSGESRHPPVACKSKHRRPFAALCIIQIECVTAPPPHAVASGFAWPRTEAAPAHVDIRSTSAPHKHLIISIIHPVTFE
jgi:hypothetical protein